MFYSEIWMLRLNVSWVNCKLHKMWTYESFITFKPITKCIWENDVAFLFKLNSKKVFAKVFYIAITSINILLVFLAFAFLVRLFSMVVNTRSSSSPWCFMSFMFSMSFLSSPSTILRFCNLFICLIAFSTTQKISTLFKFPSVVFASICASFWTSKT